MSSTAVSLLQSIVATTANEARVQATTPVSAQRMVEFLPRHTVVTVAIATKLLDPAELAATRAVEAVVAAILLQGSNRQKLRLQLYYQGNIEGCGSTPNWRRENHPQAGCTGFFAGEGPSNASLGDPDWLGVGG